MKKEKNEDMQLRRNGRWKGKKQKEEVSKDGRREKVEFVLGPNAHLSKNGKFVYIINL